MKHEHKFDLAHALITKQQEPGYGYYVCICGEVKEVEFKVVKR